MQRSLIIIDWNTVIKMYELIWNGEKIMFKIIPQVPRIWSSCILYNKKMQQQREMWFYKWIKNQANISAEEIIDLDINSSKGNNSFSLKIKRPYVETVSITKFLKGSSCEKLFYKDFLNNSKYTLEF